MKTAILVATTFVACSVEMIEALTIVLAVGITRGWRAARFGVLVAFGSTGSDRRRARATLTLIPLDTLRLVIGFLLLAFGLQWLRKAILRARVASSHCTTKTRSSPVRCRRASTHERSRAASTGTRSRCRQRCVPRGPRGRVYRDRVRCDASRPRARCDRGRCGTGDGRHLRRSSSTVRSRAYPRTG